MDRLDAYFKDLSQGLSQDLSHALRRLRQRPAATLGAATTLALGLGAVVALATVFDAVVRQPFPFPDAERLVKVMPEHRETGTLSTVSYPAYHRWRRARSLDTLALVRNDSLFFDTDTVRQTVAAAEVSSDYFTVMGVEPQLGRVLTPDDASPGAQSVAVISHRWWQQTLGGDPAVLGRSLRFGDTPVTIVGVLGPGYHGPRASLFAWADVWQPLRVDEAQALLDAPHGFGVVARLAPGVSLEAADRELDQLARGLETERPELYRGWGVALRSFQGLVTGDLERPFGLMLGAVVLVLLIAGTNVTQLLLAQLPGRRREIAIRRALGASRGRLLRLLLAETVLLALLAAVGATLLASWGIDALLALAPAEIPRLDTARLATDRLGATLFPGAMVLASLAMLVAGLLPARRLLGIGRGSLPGGGRPRAGLCRPGLWSDLRTGGRAATGGRGARRELLIAAEVALALVLVLTAALVLTSLHNLRHDDLGIRTDNLVAVRLDLEAVDPDRRAEQLASLEQEARRLEGVEAAGLVFQEPPLEGSPLVFRYWTAEQAPPEGLRHTAGWLVSGGYQRAAGLELVAGRWFTDRERSGPEQTDPSTALVINRRLAQQLWPDGEAVGRALYSGQPESPTEHRVVGVVADVRHAGPGIEPELAVEMYAPWGAPRATAALMVRSALPTEALAPALRRQVHTLLPRATIRSLRSGEHMLAASVSRQRFVTVLLALFALLALGLAAAGIYGVMATFVHGRRREIGIRMALGAPVREVVQWVLARALGSVAIGLGVGGLGFVAVQRLLGRLLFEVSPGEPAVLAVVLTLLLSVALAASWLPARRAARSDPLETLRSD